MSSSEHGSHRPGLWCLGHRCGYRSWKGGCPWDFLNGSLKGGFDWRQLREWRWGWQVQAGVLLRVQCQYPLYQVFVDGSLETLGLAELDQVAIDGVNFRPASGADILQHGRNVGRSAGDHLLHLCLECRSGRWVACQAHGLGHLFAQCRQALIEEGVVYQFAVRAVENCGKGIDGAIDGQFKPEPVSDIRGRLAFQACFTETAGRDIGSGEAGALIERANPGLSPPGMDDFIRATAIGAFRGGNGIDGIPGVLANHGFLAAQSVLHQVDGGIWQQAMTDCLERGQSVIGFGCNQQLSNGSARGVDWLNGQGSALGALLILQVQGPRRGGGGPCQQVDRHQLAEPDRPEATQGSSAQDMPVFVRCWLCHGKMPQKAP